MTAAASHGEPDAAGQEVRWHATPRTLSLATAGLLGLAVAVVTGHAALLLLAAPALAALAVVPRGRRPVALEAHVALSASRCFEGEDVELTVSVGGEAGGRPLDEITVALELSPGTGLADGQPVQTFVRTSRAEPHWTLRPARWGRQVPAVVRVSCRSGMGAWQADLRVGAGWLDVFPRPARVRPRLVPAELLRRIGEHTGRAVGQGTEFAGIRPFVPGDRIRDINYPVSARRGQWHVNQRAAQRAADLVVMIDAFSEAGPPGETTLDTSVHGAAALAAAYLRTSDRVGVVGLGGMLQWLGPAPGMRHFYRIAEMMLGIRFESVVTPNLVRIPRTALPPGALVVLFSPLLDKRVLSAITDLRQRGFALIVVDVLRHEPPVEPRSEMSALALRLWRLDRAALRSGLERFGVPVLPWHAGDGLDAALAPANRVVRV